MTLIHNLAMLLPLAAMLLQVGQPDVPVIGKMAGITVGLTSIQDFEKRHGKGLAIVGGHPRGARLWYDAKLGIEIFADGFYFSDRGEVVDSLRVWWIEPSAEDRRIPRIHIAKDEYGLLARVTKGMSKAQCQAAIGTSQPLDDVHMLGLVKYPDKLGNKDDDRFQEWTADLLFGDHGLEQISVGAE